MTKISTSHFKGLPILTSATQNLQYYTQILDRIYDQLFSLMTYYSRITVIRVDLRFPDTPKLSHKEEGVLLSAYIARIKRHLGRLGNYGRSKVVYVAVKEIGETNGKSHFHVFFGFQSKFRSLGKINASGHTDVWRIVDETWVKLSGGTTHIVPKVHMCERGNIRAFKECFEHLSYLAKTRTKQFCTHESYKRYTSSRLPIKVGTLPWTTDHNDE